MKNQAIFLALILGYVFPVGAGRLPPSADPRIGMLELRVWELTLETNVRARSAQAQIEIARLGRHALRLARFQKDLLETAENGIGASFNTRPNAKSQRQQSRQFQSNDFHTRLL